MECLMWQLCISTAIQILLKWCTIYNDKYKVLYLHMRNMCSIDQETYIFPNMKYIHMLSRNYAEYSRREHSPHFCCFWNVKLVVIIILPCSLTSFKELQQHHMWICVLNSYLCASPYALTYQHHCAYCSSLLL